ncbi:transforming growth factor beta activator LRRC32-like, partial [Chelydra serpentina]
AVGRGCLLLEPVMFLSEHRLAERGYLLLWLLPSVLKAQPSAEVSPKPLPCQQMQL